MFVQIENSIIDMSTITDIHMYEDEDEEDTEIEIYQDSINNKSSISLTLEPFKARRIFEALKQLLDAKELS